MSGLHSTTKELHSKIETMGEGLSLNGHSRDRSAEDRSSGGSKVKGRRPATWEVTGKRRAFGRCRKAPTIPLPCSALLRHPASAAQAHVFDPLLFSSSFSINYLSHQSTVFFALPLVHSGLVAPVGMFRGIIRCPVEGDEAEEDKVVR